MWPDAARHLARPCGRCPTHCGHPIPDGRGLRASLDSTVVTGESKLEAAAVDDVLPQAHERHTPAPGSFRSARDRASMAGAEASAALRWGRRFPRRAGNLTGGTARQRREPSSSRPNRTRERRDRSSTRRTERARSRNGWRDVRGSHQAPNPMDPRTSLCNPQASVRTEPRRTEAPPPHADRGDACGRGRASRACQRGRQPHPLPGRELRVHGCERAGQAARVHAVGRRRRSVPEHLRCRRDGRLSRIPDLRRPARHRRSSAVAWPMRAVADRVPRPSPTRRHH